MFGGRSESWLSWEAELLARELAEPALAVVRERSRLRRLAQTVFVATFVVSLLLFVGVGATLSWLGGLVLAASAAVCLGLYGWQTGRRADALETVSHAEFLDRLHLPVFGATVGERQVAVDVSGLLGRPRCVSPPLVPDERGLGGVLDGFLGAARSLPPFLERDEALDVPLDLKDPSGPSATLLGLEARFAELAEQLDAGFAALHSPSYDLPVISSDDDNLLL